MYAQPKTMEVMIEVKIPYAPFVSEDFVSSDCQNKKNASLD
jgi:hypothetical protein